MDSARATPKAPKVLRPPLEGPNGEAIQDDRGFLLPGHQGFAAVWNSISRTYRWTWDEALRQQPQNALAMRRDVNMLGMLRERQMPTAELSWTIESDDPEDAAEKEVCDGLTLIVQQMPRWNQFLITLLEALWYGRYASQLVYSWRTIKGMRRLCPTAHQPVNGDKIQYTWEGIPAILVNSQFASQFPHGSSELIEQGKGTLGIYTDRAPALLLGDKNWRQRFVIHKHEVDDSDYYEAEMAGGLHGVGIRHRCYWAWWLRQEVLAWLMDFLERAGQGLTIFYYEAGNPQSQLAAEKAAKNFGRSTVIAWPRRIGAEKQGAGVERIEVSIASGEVIQGAMDYFDGMIRRFVVGQDMSSVTNATGIGGDAQAALKADTKYRIIRLDAANLEHTLTADLVRPLKAINYPQADFECRFKFSVDQPNGKERMDAIEKAWSMGVELDAEEVREACGVSKPKEDAEIIAKGPEPSPFGVPGMPGQNPDSQGPTGQRPGKVSGNEDQQDHKNKDTTPARNVRRYNREPVETIDWNGLTLCVENKRGSVRSGSEMQFDYGYIAGTHASDGAEVDCYIGDDLDSRKVYVVEQLGQDGEWDEFKVMIGFPFKAEATAGYLANYPADWSGFGGIEKMKIKKFLDWLDDEKIEKRKPGQPARYAGDKIRRDAFDYAEASDKPQRCENCSHFSRAQENLGTCGLFAALAENVPQTFELYADVGPHMVCSAWQGAKRVELAQVKKDVELLADMLETPKGD